MSDSNPKPTDLPNVFTVDANASIPDPQSDDDPVCGACLCHDIAQDSLPPFPLCPHCGREMGEYPCGIPTVVQEHNGGENQEVLRLWVTNCYHCHNPVALVPTAIIENANHGIHYTGGRKYLPVDRQSDAVRKAAAEAVKPLITNWIERRDSGETLTADHLTWWVQSKVEELVASFLEDARRSGRKWGLRSDNESETI